jgi:hypothetical protein
MVVAAVDELCAITAADPATNKPPATKASGTAFRRKRVIF